MRLSKRSLGAATLLACVALPLGFVGCAREGGTTTGRSEKTGTTQQAMSATVMVPWGEDGLSFHPGGDESATRGPSAIGFAPGGIYVLDQLAARLVTVRPDGVVEVKVPDLPRDAVSFAVSARGELAFHRAITPQIDVYTPRGRLSGSVPVPMEARDATTVHLLSQGRVMLEHPFQERYLLGSPNMPRQPELIVPTRREGVAEDFSTTGYEMVVRHPEGEPTPTEVGRAIPRAGSHAYLIEAKPTGAPAEHGALPYEHKEILDLGESTSARIFGVKHGNACAVLEHLDLEASSVQVEREVVCIELESRRETARFRIETSTLYTPRRDLAFDGGRVAVALPTKDGLQLRTIALSEVSK